MVLFRIDFFYNLSAFPLATNNSKWILVRKQLEHLLEYCIELFDHLFSCSVCHADHKNVFVFKFWSILDLQFVFHVLTSIEL